MPNWCSTSIEIQDKTNKEGARRLYNLIEEWTSKEVKKSDFGNEWLGNICLGSNICTEETMDELYPRGSIDALDFNEDTATIYLYISTAWSPVLKMWKLIVDKYLPDADIYYTAEECGNALYQTNKEEHKYCIDSFDDRVDGMIAKNRTDLEEICKKMNLDYSNKSEEELFKLLEEQDTLYVNKFSFVTLEEAVSYEEWSNKMFICNTKSA